jgi:hypothetical protein
MPLAQLCPSEQPLGLTVEQSDKRRTGLHRSPASPWNAANRLLAFMFYSVSGTKTQAGQRDSATCTDLRWTFAGSHYFEACMRPVGRFLAAFIVGQPHVLKSMMVS